MTNWIRSKVFKEVIYNTQIPNRLLVEENGKVSLYGGKVYEKSMRMEKSTRIIKSWKRLDDAKKALIKLYSKQQNMEKGI